MTKNQKIALGCGGAGCLGLIVLAVAGVVLYVYFGRTSVGGHVQNSNYNYNSNRNSNFNSNANTNDNDNVNSNANSDSSNPSSLMPDDDKHRLLLAASLANDPDLMQRVIRKLGFITDTGGVSDDYAQFIKDHAAWAIRNSEFIKSVNSPELARAYVNAHIDD
ncbi:MAG: hypothetical protein ACREA9_01245 [Pyrinomonadaceae bacterium]